MFQVYSLPFVFDSYKIVSQNLTSLVLTLGKFFLVTVKAKVHALNTTLLFFQKFLIIFCLYQVDCKQKFLCYENQNKKVMVIFQFSQFLT